MPKSNVHKNHQMSEWLVPTPKGYPPMPDGVVVATDQHGRIAIVKLGDVVVVAGFAYQFVAVQAGKVLGLLGEVPTLEALENLARTRKL